MNKLGSEFFKAIDQFERGIIGGATWRQVVMVLGIVLGVILATVILLLQLPSLLFYLSLALTVIPAFIYGIKKDEHIKEVITFRLKVQERAYQTEYESEEIHGTIIPQKGIQEWNDPNES
ncbi:PrgI family protein [Streptococcus equi]|uniref:PrgI family protein n=1 Tax=Streptococcus equi subsp. zooepidemicus TaxID=40041 RepID=A0AAX2LMG6_STRSZ|nr:PrgI family protein [Streptococcus equi]HER9225370.1 PrgI family protein [Streptococcus pyogenes]MCD3397134.1 PrgI family protein [Streptococcus equi subsp. zooepidemicus]MCD3427207.1 PrgI family protein [Streptococcus equi subsp. zooepidemicus]MCD3436094.1 PrgI family protein [Streptococcus equi subsp. zooepidemicus]MCD3439366.1 PrgI family protein [Streptococcus equi subsp. zooepidemicus]